MPDPHVFALFLGAALALLLTPGPAVLYIVGRSVDQGVGAGLVSALGLVTGGAVHVAGAVLGISAVLAASPSALTGVTWGGAAYLAWLGWKELRAKDGEVGGEAAPQGGGRIFRQGVVVTLLNPKPLLFFVAFLPQFVREDAGDPRIQVLYLGVSFLGLALCTDSLWAVLAGRAGAWLRSPGHRRLRRRVSAGVYLILAAAAVWPGR